MMVILARIESLRQKMHELANVYGLASTQVLIASQQLDAELNVYYRLQRSLDRL